MDLMFSIERELMLKVREQQQDAHATQAGYVSTEL